MKSKFSECLEIPRDHKIGGLLGLIDRLIAARSPVSFLPFSIRQSTIDNFEYNLCDFVFDFVALGYFKTRISGR